MAKIESRSRCSGMWWLRLGGALAVLVAAAGSADAGHAISVTPDPISFGGAHTQLGGGLPGEPQFGFFQVQNTGTSKLVVTEMEIVGAGAAIMSFDDPLCNGRECERNFTLAPGEARGFSLGCTPRRPGVFSATLRIESNAHGTSTTPLTCTGNHPAVITVSPGALDFGTVHACDFGDSCGPSCATTTPPAGLTITNTAPAPSELDFYLTPTLPSSSFDDFTVGFQPTADNPIALAAGESFFVPIVFHPRDGQIWSQPLTVVSLDGPPPVTVPFHAAGGFGELVIDTPPDLGPCPYGASTVTTITGHNAGTSCIELGAVSMFQDCVIPDGPAFTLLQPGESFTRTVVCTPTLEGFGLGDLFVDILHDDPEFIEERFTCTPTGGALTTDTSAVEFDGRFAVRVGASATQRIQVTNAGTDATQLTAITSTDPRFSGAVVGASLPVTLAPGDSAAVDIAFAPTDEAGVAGTVTLAVSSGLGATVSVIGEGFVNDGVTFPRSIDFGGVFYPGPASRVFQLFDHGDAPLTVQGVTIDPPGDFTVSDIAPGTVVPAGDSVVGTVTAVPTALGLLQATASFALDGSPDATLAVQAFVTDGSMLILPQQLDLGSVDVAAGAHDGHVSITNETGHAITFATCSVVGDGALVLHTACPITFSTLGTVDLDVAFDPDTAGEARGTIVITGTGFATGALRIPVHGTGVAAARRADARAAAAEPAGGGCQAGGPGAGLGLAIGLIFLGRRRTRRGVPRTPRIPDPAGPEPRQP